MTCLVQYEEVRKGLVALAWKEFGSQTTSVKVVCLLSYADRYNAFFFQNLVLPLFFFGSISPIIKYTYFGWSFLR